MISQDPDPTLQVLTLDPSIEVPVEQVKNEK
jgi:hypothetical protein